jgi:hypothetical protein
MASRLAAPPTGCLGGIRKRVEEGFGWLCTVAGMQKMKSRGMEQVAMAFILASCVPNLMRMAKMAPPDEAFTRP